MDERNILNRAFGAYFRSTTDCYLLPELKKLPCLKFSGIYTTEDLKNYVVLRDDIGNLLSVYRITTSGQLKKLCRWPKEIKKEKGEN